ncbi:MAG: DUF7948 domain-containing protein [Planctomycetota bacterium]|jgi:hypothetical protein
MVSYKQILRTLIVLSVVAMAASGAPAGTRSVDDDARAGGNALDPGLTQAGRPLAFVQNQGQWNSPARFVARRGPMVASFEQNAIVLHLEQGESNGRAASVLLKLAFEGASDDVAIEGAKPQPGRYNYFLGKDRSRWRTDVPAYDQVIYRGLYDGIDLRVRDESRRLKYDLLLAPGADLNDVIIRCGGINGLEIDRDGSLVAHTDLGPIVQAPPTTWYERPSGERVEVPCEYCLVDDMSYGFEVIGHDPRMPLVIDPGLEWATFLGGSEREFISCVAVDESGVVTVAGITESTGTKGLPVQFPTTDGAYDTTPDTMYDTGFISRLSADGTQLLWSTYLGGEAGLDWIFDLVVHDGGMVTVVGQTFASDFPTTTGAYDGSYGGSGDGFVARLDPNQTGVDQLVWSTLIGTAAHDRAVAVDLDESGDVIVAGYTESAVFDVSAGAYDESFNGGRDVFVARLTADGSSQSWATYLGGSGFEGFSSGDAPFPLDADVMDIDVRSGSGDVYLFGYTQSTDFPTTLGAYDTTYNGGSADAFASWLSADGADLVWSTYLGASGTFDDVPRSISVDDTTGLVTVAGIAKFGDFPTTVGAYDETFNGDRDAFVTRLDPAQFGISELVYSTYLGTPGSESCFGLAVDSSGAVTVSGWAAPGFPMTPGAYDETFNGGDRDVYVARLLLGGAGGTDLLYSTYIGTAINETSFALASAGANDVVVAGATQSANFPVTPGAYDTEYNGGTIDGWVARLDLCPVDLNDDGAINVLDLIELLLCFGPPATPPCDTGQDINGDGTVNVLDLIQLLLAFGTSCP